MSVVGAVTAEIEKLRVSESALAATALAMAEEIDAANSATSKSMCAKVLMDALAQLRDMAPPQKQEDRVDEVAKRRKDRIRRTAG